MAKPTHTPPSQEFEHKFLAVVSCLPRPLPEPVRIVQGYCHLEEPYDRIRITDDREAVLEYKASKNFESPAMPMHLDVARYMLDHHCKGALVEKLRRVLPAPFEGLKFELDEFGGKNQGLWLIELEHPKGFHFKRKELPAFVGPDVSDDDRFKNRNLAVHPFQDWSRSERKEIRKRMGL